MGDVERTLAQTENLSVDVEHLENIGAYLDIVVRAIRDDVRPAVYEAHRLARTGGDGSRSALGGPGFVEAEDLAVRVQNTYTAVDSSLKSIADDLEKVAKAVRDMAERYSTVEERNALTAAEFSRILTGS